jgi:hypothetical protein
VFKIHWKKLYVTFPKNKLMHWVAVCLTGLSLNSGNLEVLVFDIILLHTVLILDLEHCIS